MSDGKSEAMSKPPVLYLAAPYTHPTPQVRQERYEKVNFAAHELMTAGFIVYSPISHSHPIELASGIYRGHDFWLPQMYPFLDACDAMVIYQLPGWEKSFGVGEEKGRHGKRPVIHWSPEQPIEETADRIRTIIEWETPPRERVLAEAARITSTERQRDYGHPRDNFAAIAGMWNAYKGAKKDADFTPSDVAAMFALTKMARQANSPKRDNWTDLAGYARCGAQCDGFED